jgi:hypothetical protein
MRDSLLFYGLAAISWVVQALHHTRLLTCYVAGATAQNELIPAATDIVGLDGFEGLPEAKRRNRA